MATTGIMNGTLWAIYIAGTKVANGTNATINVNAETRETTNKDSSGWAERLEGLRSWDGSGDFMFAEDAAYGESDIWTLINGRTSATIMLSSEVSGDYSLNGTAYITNLTKSGGVEDNVTFSISFEGTGALSRTVVS